MRTSSWDSVHANFSEGRLLATFVGNNISNNLRSCELAEEEAHTQSSIDSEGQREHSEKTLRLLADSLRYR